MGKKIAAYNATTGTIVAFYDSVDSPPESGTPTVEITDAQWQECLSQPGWTVINGNLIAPEQPTSAQVASANLRISAQAQLDLVTGPRGQLARCMRNGVAFPATWNAYCNALVSIANGSDTKSTELPSQPPYVVGT